MVKQIFTAILLFTVLYGCKKNDNTIDPLKKGLVAYYPFNGNTNDESGNANHGTALKNELTSDHNSVSNRAFNFDGTNYIKVPNSSSLSSIKKALSITAWIYNIDQLVSIICKADYDGATMQFRLFSDNAILFANNGQSADFTATLNPLNTWKHIAIVSDGISAKYYLNGILQATIASHSDEVSTDTTTAMYIGADTHGTTEYYRGKLDEIRIYNRVLSDSEVQKIYSGK